VLAERVVDGAAGSGGDAAGGGEVVGDDLGVGAFKGGAVSLELPQPEHAVGTCLVSVGVLAALEHGAELVELGL
jgi:hypothetical protein